MEQFNFWQTVAQGGIAILVLATIGWLFWKQIQAQITKNSEENATLRADFMALVRDKDALQKEFRQETSHINEQTIDFIKSMQEKYNTMEQQWLTAINDNTAAYRALKMVIEQRIKD